MRQHKDSIISYLLTKGKRVLPFDLLDFFIENPEFLTSKNVEEWITKYPEILDDTDSLGNNILDVYEKGGNVLNCAVLQCIHQQRAHLTDKSGRNALSLIIDLLDNYPQAFTTNDLLYIQQQQPELINKIFINAVAGNNREYIQKMISKINTLNPSSLITLLYHYATHPTFLTTNNLQCIEQQHPELTNILFLCSVGANNEEYFEKIIQQNPQKATTFTDSEGRGIYHYTALGAFEFYDKFFELKTDDETENKESHFSTTLIFKHEFDFDENGLLYYLGTNGGSKPYQNPAEIGLVSVDATSTVMKQEINSVVGRGISYYYDARDQSTKQPPNIIVYLPCFIKLTHYTVKHSNNLFKSVPLRNWELRASENGVRWETLSVHDDGELLEKNGGTYTWIVNSNTYFNHFCLSMRKQNQWGWMLPCSGIEFYGKVIGLDPVAFYGQHTYCLKHNGKSPFFQLCTISDSKNIEELITKYPELLDTKDENNNNILDHYNKNKDLLNDQMLQSIYEQNPDLKPINYNNE